MALINLPVQNDVGNFRYKIALDGIDYTLFFKYNGRLDRWFVSIGDSDENILIDEIKLIRNANITASFRYKDIPQNIMLAYNYEDEEQPNIENFGGSVLFHYDETV